MEHRIQSNFLNLDVGNPNIQFAILKIERKIVHAESAGIKHVGTLLSYFAWPVPVTLLRVYNDVELMTITKTKAALFGLLLSSCLAY